MAEADLSLYSQTYAYKYVESRPIELDVVYRPGVAVQGIRKSLIYFHGGGMVSGWRKARFPGLPLDLLIQAGWQVLTVDYRLLPECSIADIVEDLRDLEKWTLSDGRRLANVDSKSIAIAGSSAGSLVSILALSSWTQLKPCAFLSLWGMINTSSSWYSTPKIDETLFMGIPATHIQQHASFDQLLKNGSSPEVWEDKSEIATPGSRPQFFLWMLKRGKIGALLTNSFQAAFDGAVAGPLHLVSASFPPTVTLHGDVDSIAPVEDSRDLTARLNSVGVNAKLIEVPGADHGIQPYDMFHGYIEKAVQIFDAASGK